MAAVDYIGPDGRQPRPRSAPRPLLRTMLGDVLRRNRLAQARTLSDVASAARVSMPYLSELERGRKEASSEVLAAVCDALRIELSDVLTEVGVALAQASVPRAAVLVRSAAHHRHLQRPARGAGDVVCLAA
jgi:transcriptional regulator with XRE-family HTH domain